MIKSISQALFLFALVGFMTACNSGPSGEKAETKEAVDAKNVSDGEVTEYTVDAGGMLKWEGSKLVGKTHNGTIAIKEGTIKVQGDKVVGGVITVDMNSINDLDIEKTESKAKLEGHLKSADFFDVAKYPVATFEITDTKVLEGAADASNIVAGNLTMKDKTKNIVFKATIEMDGDKMEVTSPSFVIDRSEWDVQYGSGKFFDNLTKDQIINDNIGLSINLTATKKPLG